MSGFSSPASSPRVRARSRSPTINTDKHLPSIPEDAESAGLALHHHALPPSPPPYDEQDEERAALIREHLARVFALVNEQSVAAAATAPPHPHHHHRQQHHEVQYNFDPEWHGAQAAEFYQAARRRQQAQVLGLLLFVLFIFSLLALFVFFVIVGLRAHFRAANEWEKRRQCLISRGAAPHCHGSSPYNRW